MAKPNARTPLARLAWHLEAMSQIVAELQGEAAIEGKAKQTTYRQSLADQAHQLIKTSPGLNLTQLQSALKAQHCDLRPAIDSLVRDGLVTVTVTEGRKRARLHFPRTHEGNDDN